MFDRRIKSKAREYCRALLVDGRRRSVRRTTSHWIPLMPVPSPHEPRLIHALEKPNLRRLPRSRFVITIEQQLKTIRNVSEVF
jgi:hypothetical protein